MFDISLNHTLVLARQDDGPPLATDPAGTTSEGSDPAPRTAPDGLFGGNLLFIFALLFVFIIIWSIMGQRREKKKRDAVLSSIRKHDKVQTIGGVIGSVVEVRPDMVVLKVDESSNTRMTFARSAIQQILKESPDREPDEGDSRGSS